MDKCLLCTKLGPSHALSHWIFSVTLWDKYCHFTDEKLVWHCTTIMCPRLEGGGQGGRVWPSMLFLFTFTVSFASKLRDCLYVTLIYRTSLMRMILEILVIRKTREQHYSGESKPTWEHLSCSLADKDSIVNSLDYLLPLLRCSLPSFHENQDWWIQHCLCVLFIFIEVRTAPQKTAAANIHCMLTMTGNRCPSNS